jgi:hypothetical protein
MSETEREALAEVIQSVTDNWDEPLDEVHDVPAIINAILASDWLAGIRATARAEALEAAAIEGSLHFAGTHTGREARGWDVVEAGWLRGRAAGIRSRGGAQ